MKSKYTLLTLTFTALFCSLTSGQDVSKEIIASSRLPTVKIQTNTSSGTGFFISADLILTCYHVVGGIKRDTSGKV
ncbi:MAG: hypothetical protein EOO43_16180 [Flavobacterium sp.]|nr:MAG: hypothetical protein EOO43_16180 [Flavobacterium sp.]